MKSKICGISDIKTLKYITNHSFPPKFIGFIVNYIKSKRYVSQKNLNKLLKINKKNSFYVAVLVKPDKNILEKTVFFKLSPLIDPYKYLGGKYDLSDNNLFNLPKFNTNDCNPKIMDTNNSSYVDGFFTYLTSQLLNRYDFIHGLDYYGSYLAIKNKYIIDIADDLSCFQGWTRTRNTYFKKEDWLVQDYYFEDDKYLFNDKDDKTQDPFKLIFNNIDDDDFIEKNLIRNNETNNKKIEDKPKEEKPIDAMTLLYGKKK